MKLLDLTLEMFIRNLLNRINSIMLLKVDLRKKFIE